VAKSSGPLSICVINLKGGVGKSTISALLAREAFSKGLDVLTIDLDPQANLSQGLMPHEYDRFLKDKKPSVVELFDDYIPPKKGAPSPSDLSADDVVVTIDERSDRSLQLIPSRFDFSDNLTDSIRPDPKVLAKFLARNFRQKDIILIDCSPTESVFTTAAYHASSQVLVPVKPEYFATVGFPLLHQSLENFTRKNRAHDISVAGIVINNAFYDGGNDGGPEKIQALKDIKLEAKKNGWHIFKKQLPHSRGFPKMMRGNYTYLGNAQWAFSNFSREFFNHLGL